MLKKMCFRICYQTFFWFCLQTKIRQIKHNAFFGLTILRALYLGRNQISFIEKDAFVNLLNLTHLVLAYNELQGLDFHWFRNLNSLYVENNKIERVTSLIHTWPSSMKRVNLNKNKIPVILPIQNMQKCFFWEEILFIVDVSQKCLSYMKFQTLHCVKSAWNVILLS